MPQDTRSYMAKQWDALTGVLDGFVAGTATFLAARQAMGTVTLGTAALSTNVHHAIGQIHAGFFGTPSGTSVVSIYAGGTHLFSTNLVAGNNTVTFTPPFLAPANTLVEVVLNPGGGTATLNVNAGTVVPFPYRAS